MELILEWMYERRKSQNEWKQIICAVMLALFVGGMYHSASVEAEYAVGKNGTGAPSVSFYAGVHIGIEMDSLKERFIPDTAPETFRETVAETFDDTEYPAGSFNDSAAENAGHAGIKENKKSKEKIMKKSVTVKADFIPSDNKKEDVNLEKLTENVEAPKKVEEIIKDSKPSVPKEFSGFICDADGYIIGISEPSKIIKDSMVVLPRNSACTGIKKGSFNGLEKMVSEIYIPANIINIESGFFDEFLNLIYIEAQPENPRYYSVNGILYDRNGDVAGYPNRQCNQ